MLEQAGGWNHVLQARDVGMRIDSFGAATVVQTPAAARIQGMALKNGDIMLHKYSLD